MYTEKSISPNTISMMLSVKRRYLKCFPQVKLPLDIETDRLGVG